ncbi:MAG TPA: IclR family transcriptional regulator [Dehalococcoidales bacterium]|nr:IclR family transcriptional regulator [Dehalococcoidales bacterium]
MDTVQRTLDILEIFLEKEGEIGIAELSSISRVNITTVHRIASDLVERGYLRQKGKRGKYSLGVKLLEFNAAIQHNLRIGELAQPFLHTLSAASGEYTEIAVLESSAAVTVAQAEVKRNLRISNIIGERLPLHATSLGKILLAHLDAPERNNLYGRKSLETFTENTITDVNRLEHEVEKIRQQGYALDREEYDLGIWSVAAPVFDYNGLVVAGLAIAAPSARTNGRKPKKMISMVLAASAEISRELGYKTPATPRKPKGLPRGRTSSGR